MAKEKKYKPRKSGLDTAITTIIVIVILVVLGLSVYSIGTKIKDKLPGAGEEMVTETVQTAADAKGMTVEDFMTEYGLTDVTAETAMSEAAGKMTCGNYAKYTDVTFEELVSANKLPESVTAETTWLEAQDLIPIGVMVGGDEQFAQLKEQYGLDDSITAETPSGEAMPVIEQKMMEAMQAQSEASAEGEAVEGEAAEEAPAEEAAEAPVEEATEAPVEAAAE